MSEKPTLVILAAGMGSRYGGLKQLDAFGPSGESIIDYSIYDARRSGFGKIVFVVRRHFKDQFEDAFFDKLQGIDSAFVAQELDMIPAGHQVPEGREKPWGTAHAVLVTEKQVHQPFAVINADDFYGYDAFVRMREFLQNSARQDLYCTVGYHLVNTVSPYGTVNRGVCEVDDEGYLKDVVECIKIGKKNDAYRYEESIRPVELNDQTVVSMNMWGFHPSFFQYASQSFGNFLTDRGHELKSEFFIPLCISEMISSGQARVKVLETTAKWFGVTYREDKPFVKESIEQLIVQGEYPEKL